MHLLDCFDSASTLASIGRAIGVEPDHLADAIHRYDSARLADYPYEDVALSVLTDLGTDLSQARFDGACFFHGTRVVNPSTFRRRGLLPLDVMLDETWQVLRILAEASHKEWEAFRATIESDGGGHDGYLYRLKTHDAMHHGPQAHLVREVHVDLPQSSHDYLSCPEIVQDISRCYEVADLEARFVEASTPCIVKFWAPCVSAWHVETAFCFLHARLSGEPLGFSSCGGFDGSGTAVPPEAIIDVEVVESPPVA
ncbi:hypothetical protein [Conexibacter arvalis]|uniref:Uncharacterized protein n=1 Tax=Conexibacter arvalis TaxID=912552 RepID=A0A840IB37_9ACTN|nr:hypothetical protein [Conexibacter arvalis]MBB4661565.1 hypothetical protein [Conexibacter arvalis]